MGVFSANVFFHLENTEDKEVWEAIGRMEKLLCFSTEDEISRGIRRVKKELNFRVTHPGSVEQNHKIYR